MSDTTSRSPSGAPSLIADALMRSLAGTDATLRMTSTNQSTSQSELGIAPSVFVDAVISPVVMRKLRPGWQESNQSRWEMLVSATSVQQQVEAFDLESAQALFAMTLAITVAGQEFLIESISANEAFGAVYLYRVLLREARRQQL